MRWEGAAAGARARPLLPPRAPAGAGGGPSCRAGGRGAVHGSPRRRRLHRIDGACGGAPRPEPPGALAAVQCMLLVAEAERRRAAAATSSGANGGGGDDPSRHGGSPLVELGTQFHLWQRLGMLIEVGASERHLEVRDASRRLLEKVLGALALSPHELPSALPSRSPRTWASPQLTCRRCGRRCSTPSRRRTAGRRTSAGSRCGRARSLRWWRRTTARPRCTIRWSTPSLAPPPSRLGTTVVPAPMGCRLARRHVVGFVAAKRPWLRWRRLALSPQLPMDAPSSAEALEPSPPPISLQGGGRRGSKVAAALGSMVGRRTYGNLSEDKRRYCSTRRRPMPPPPAAAAARSSCRRRTRHGA